MPSPTPPPPLPDPDDDRRLAQRRARAGEPRSGGSAGASRSSGGRPPNPPSKRQANAWTRLPSRTKAIVVAAAIVVVVIVAGTIIGRRSSDEPSTIKTDDAVSTLQSMLDGVERNTTLSACPFGSISSIVGDLDESVTFPTTPVSATPMIVKGDDTDVDEVLCAASTPDDRLRTGRSIYVYATPAPTGSYSDYLTARLDGAKAKLDDPRKHAGGTIYTWCVTPSADFRGGCGADWVADGGGVVFGLQIVGGEITATQVADALEHELPAMVERFGTDAPVSSTPGSAPMSTPASTAPTTTGGAVTDSTG